MKRLLLALGLFLIPGIASAASLVSPCTQVGPVANAECDPVNKTNPLPVGSIGYPPGATPITGNAQGTTGAVVGTLAAAVGKTTYICGVHIDAIGGSASIGPITIAGIVGSSMVFQGSSSAAGSQTSTPETNFTPCIPASAPNTAITITTTADGTATAVDVNSWGFQY